MQLEQSVGWKPAQSQSQSSAVETERIAGMSTNLPLLS